MRLFRNKDEIDILDDRLLKANEQIDVLIKENNTLRNRLIEERNSNLLEREALALARELFEKQKENIFKIAESRNEHLEAELEFIKKHRMLPIEAKFYKVPPRRPQMMKKLK